MKNVGPTDHLTDEQIKAALDAALARKSLTKVGGTQLTSSLVTSPLNVPKPTSPGSLPAGALAPVGAQGGWQSATGGSAAGITSISKGELAVDMYDPASHDLVRRGVASKTLDPKAKPEKRQKNLNKAIAKLMRDYPPSEMK